MAETPGMSIDAKTLDNKLFVYHTNRPFGTMDHFTSEGDSTASLIAIGGGTELKVEHNVGDPIDQSAYVDFNVIENKSYLHEGYMIWGGAKFDTVTLQIVPQVTRYSGGTDTEFNLYGGYLILPAPYNGNINVDQVDMRLVESTVSLDSGKRAPAFWNATYDTTNHCFTGISPAPYGDGTYNMFGYEVTFHRFVNKVLLLDQGIINLTTTDVAEIGHGIRFKLGIHTDSTSDHDWRAAFILSMSRTKTA